MSEYVQDFSQGDASMKDLLGGKGANLAEMTNIGLPVPPGFTITTKACVEYMRNGSTPPSGLWDEVKDAVKRLEESTGKTFGRGPDLLLFSVRSGAVISMPGMMDTVLNLGLTDGSVRDLAEATGDPRFAYDCQRRFIQMFGDVVLGVDHDKFEDLLRARKEARNVRDDLDLSADDWKDIIEGYRNVLKEEGKEIPADPMEQLRMAVLAVFDSWNGQRAVRYRELNGIPHDLGTAVNVQMMVFGNMGPDSATGVGFTRNPATGEKRLYGEFLINAQGEDVVAGIRTPKEISRLKDDLPEQYAELEKAYRKLEMHYRDMEDFEFTIEKGTFYLLQTRTGKRTAFAAVRIAVDMVDEGLITPQEAVARVEPDELTRLFAPVLDPKEKKIASDEGRFLTVGLAASPGGACGIAAFSAEEAEELAGSGEPVILVRSETSPEDIGGMAVSKGILTATGGMTSHAAVVARGMGVPCVAGAGDIRISQENGSLTCGGITIRKGDIMAIDGFNGSVFAGRIAVQPSEIMQVLQGDIEPSGSDIYGYFRRFMKWADEFRELGVRTNADTPRDAAMARKLGAEGIGLCRTEHMFFEGERIDAMREMILASDVDGRQKALDKLLPYQKEDFLGIFKAMEGLPVTIRLLDPPLHEFLPREEEAQKELAETTGIPLTAVKEKVEELSEFNPMLGHRGCRLGITYPEITRMQTKAIMESACELAGKGVAVIPEIMVPLAGTVEEFAHQKRVIDDIASKVMKETGVKVEYSVGTMIEIPRAAITADKIAAEAQFFSFGTNDLTQMTYGYSRDDAGRFIREYLEKGILKHDPFQSIDEEGVGVLVDMGTSLGRGVRGDLKVGICGEHGGDPSSIRFCSRVGLDYVSCSPYRVPVARLAAAQAALENGD